MKRLPIFLFSAALAAAFPSSLHADNPKDEVNGEGDLVDVGDVARTFSFSIKRTADGFAGDVRLAQASEMLGTFAIQGHAVCMSVSGSTAAIGVAIDAGTGTAEGKTGLVLFLEDNGIGVQEKRDRAGFSDFVTDPSACALSDTGAADVKSGDIAVRDGNTPPATTE